MKEMNLLQNNVQLHTETSYMVNGDIRVYVCPWNQSEEPMTEGTQRSYPARITVMETGEISVKAYRIGSQGPRYRKVFRTEHCEILKAENVPFEQYSRMIEDCDVLLDQLYGYSPAMNALLAMSKGKIVVGGAEPECYDILDEKELRPMINVVPDETDVYNKLKWIVENKNKLATMQQESIDFIKKHHSPAKVAEQYIKFWNK
jgi:glycosyltransferase involved in cell wall biosynthesis